MLRSRSLMMMPIAGPLACDIDHRKSRAPSAPRAHAGYLPGSGRALCKGSPTMGKRRLDTLLAERGLFPPRSGAAASVMVGEFYLGGPRPGERRAEKPGELVDVATRVRLAQTPQFVSRGGIKLANALAASGLDVRGRGAGGGGPSS